MSYIEAFKKLDKLAGTGEKMGNILEDAGVPKTLTNMYKKAAKADAPNQIYQGVKKLTGFNEDKVDLAKYKKLIS